jgi:hypothetical protein
VFLTLPASVSRSSTTERAVAARSDHWHPVIGPSAELSVLLLRREAVDEHDGVPPQRSAMRRIGERLRMVGDRRVLDRAESGGL